ncbi:hypothetical protein PFISCL1PPCAC_2259, partial [Pristionchus fissidentatus]
GNWTVATMTNGAAKKKNKKTEEMKKKEEEKEKMQRELDEKRARIAANVEKAKRQQNEMMEQGSSTSKMETEEMRKKKAEEKDGDKKRVGDKRRDSLGGSVSTSSNSSGTDCDEALSEAARLVSAITPPPNGSAAESFADTSLKRINIADTLSSIHQVAQSVVEAGTAEALNVASEFLPYTMTSHRPHKAGARNLAVASGKKSVETAAEGSGVCSSPTPRKVPTPILAAEGGRTAPSPSEGDIASFRSIADECPAEIPGATLNYTIAYSNLQMEKEEKEKEKEVVEEARQETTNRGLEQFRLQDDRQKQHLRPGGRIQNFSKIPEDYRAQTFPWLNELMQNNFVNTMADPLLPEHVFGNFDRRSEFGHHNYELTNSDSVKNNPTAYLAERVDQSNGAEAVDLIKEYEQRLRSEMTEKSGWVEGERAVLKNIYDDIPKLLKKQRAPWIRDLLQLVFEGKAKKVWNRMRIIVNLLRKQREYALLSYGELMTHIATVLLEGGTNHEIGYSYVHVLAAQGKNQKSCGEEKHGRCGTLLLVLAPLSPESLQRALSLKCTAWASRKPLHFATSTGQPCQLDVLQTFFANGTESDDLCMTPIVHAVIRDQLLMVRQLAWYGVDALAVDEKSGWTTTEWKNGGKKSQLGRSSVDFIAKRNDAFERVIAQWMTEITSHFAVKKGISDVHTLSCYPSSDQQVESIPINNSLMTIPHWIGHVNKTIHLKLRSNITMEDRANMFLLLLPFSYRRDDISSSSSSPSIIRHTLFHEDNDRAKPVNFMKSHPFLNVRDPSSTRLPVQKPLVPMLHNHNNGVFWAYKIPSDVFSNEVMSVSLSMDLSPVKLHLRPHLRLLAQAVVCSN